MTCSRLIRVACLGALALASCKKGQGTVEFAVTASPPITGVTVLRGTVTVGARSVALEIVPQPSPTSIGASATEQAVFAVSLPADDGDMVTVDLAAYGAPASGAALAEGTVTTAFSAGGAQPKRVELRLGPPGSVPRGDMAGTPPPDMAGTPDLGGLPDLTTGAMPEVCTLVPGGSFPMGASDVGSDAMPTHTVTVGDFCLDETEVTVAAYANCVSAGACTTPGLSPGCNWMAPGHGAHPVNCVDWTQAKAFCEWLGAALPTEAQWEHAARYDSVMNNRDYPWGDTTPTSELCWNKGDTCMVGSYPGSNSWLDMQDLAGNVWEWVFDVYDPSYYSQAGAGGPDPTGPAQGASRGLRGGAWTSTSITDLRTAHRSSDAPTVRRNDVGFRCARKM